MIHTSWFNRSQNSNGVMLVCFLKTRLKVDWLENPDAL